jgi:hypothetical protein
VSGCGVRGADVRHGVEGASVRHAAMSGRGVRARCQTRVSDARCQRRVSGGGVSGAVSEARYRARWVVSEAVAGRGCQACGVRHAGVGRECQA